MDRKDNSTCSFSNDELNPTVVLPVEDYLTLSVSGSSPLVNSVPALPSSQSSEPSFGIFGISTMPAGGNVECQQYTLLTGLTYVFNLIVGTGALALPAVFAAAGWGLSLSILLALAFISFLTVTFVIESMSIANALSHKKIIDESNDEIQNSNVASTSASVQESDPLIYRGLESTQDESADLSQNLFEIRERFEMGKMASMFFGTCGLYAFYICLTLYLYGDLAIYITAVAKSLRDVVCTNANNTKNSTVMSDSDGCWTVEGGLNRISAYRLFTIIFIVLLGPFAFFNVTKTKYLQMMTSLMRWFAFIVMIVLALVRLGNGEGTGKPNVANFRGLPNLFGVCIYSFMCHHSLPSLVVPISNKKRLIPMFALDYTIVCTFYVLIAITGVFAFDKLQDLYTLNFEPAHGDAVHEKLISIIIEYFLALFPVFTLSTNFPIIAITLRNNLQALFQAPSVPGQNRGVVSTRLQCSKQMGKVMFPLCAILPPFLISLCVEDVQVLVTITGAFAGAGIQYVIPACLVFYARRKSPYADIPNRYTSPFRNGIWLFFVLLWTVVSTSFVTVHLFSTYFSRQ